jgi:hypothetical protein
VADKSIDIVIAHELIHVERFCQGGKGITNCTSCRIQEGKAFEDSCADAFPDDTTAQERCVKCGVYFGCKHLPADTGRGVCVRDEEKPCTSTDLGVDVK